MSFLFEQTVGKHTYIYECTSYRDDKGAPRNKRIPVGKVDSKTGKRVFKDSYLERMREAGTPIEPEEDEKLFSIADIKKSSIRECGMFHLLRHVAERDGLSQALSEAFPEIWKEIFILACFLVVTGDPFLYCEEWVRSTECISAGNMSSQRVSELLAAIKPECRESFYRAWCALRRDREYLALDITSSSSYSELIDDVEWGYNRDGEHLPQVNICMLMGEESMLPIYQTVFSGSVKDVSTLETMLAEFTFVTGDKPVLAVMDKGFYSKKNVDSMLGDETKKFIISVPFTSAFAKNQVESERKDIDSVSNTIFNNGDSLRAVTHVRSWGKERNIYTHVYFNARKASHLREALYANVARLKDEVESHPEKYAVSTVHKKYLSIRRSGKNDAGYTISIREDVVDKELRTSGWIVVISNDISDAKEAIRIYRAKDVVEKGFLRLKKSLDLGRLRIHSQDRMRNKVFVGFIALILMSELHRVMSEKSLYRSMTMRQMIRILSKLRTQTIGKTRIVYPVTKEQRIIFEAFNIDPPA
jgi:transposase